MPNRSLAVLAATALLPALLAAGCDDGGVAGVAYTVTERLTGDGPLGTCSFETGQDPLPRSEAEGQAWSAGSVLGVAVRFARTCGDGCPPVADFEWFLVGKPSFSFEPRPAEALNGLQGEVTGVLTASGPGIGGIGIHHKGSTYGPIAVEAFAPAQLGLTRFESWQPGQPGPQESLLPETVRAGTAMNVLLRPFDSSGGRLCGRGPVDTAGTTGIALSGDPALGAASPQANSVIVLTFEQAGTATLALAFSGARLTRTFDVRP